MALFYVDGMDKYTSDTDMQDKGWIFDDLAQVAYNSTGGRFGGGALEVDNTRAAVDLVAMSAVGGATWVIGFNLKVSALPASDLTIFRATNPTPVTTNFQLRLTSTGALRAWSGNGLGNNVGSAIITAGEWNRIEMKVFGSNGGTVDMEVNGAVYLDTLQDTLSASPGTVGYAEFFGSSTVKITLDDIVVGDNTGGAPENDLLGDLRISTLTPTAEGNSSQFTPLSGTDNALMVDEGGGPDGDTTYNESSTGGHSDLHVHDNLPGDTNVVIAVAVNVVARDTNGAGRGINLQARENVTTSTVDPGVPTLGPNYKTHQAIFMDNPDTASAWTEAEINAAEFGYSID